jgi:hypothetical protein
MEYVYIIIREQKECRGHGDYGNMFKLETYGGYDEILYPAFKTEEEANNYLKQIEQKQGYSVSGKPLKIIIFNT